MMYNKALVYLLMPLFLIMDVYCVLEMNFPFCRPHYSTLTHKEGTLWLLVHMSSKMVRALSLHVSTNE